MSTEHTDQSQFHDGLLTIQDILIPLVREQSRLHLLNSESSNLRHETASLEEATPESATLSRHVRAQSNRASHLESVVRRTTERERITLVKTHKVLRNHFKNTADELSSMDLTQKGDDRVTVFMSTRMRDLNKLIRILEEIKTDHPNASSTYNWGDMLLDAYKTVPMVSPVYVGETLTSPRLEDLRFQLTTLREQYTGVELDSNTTGLPFKVVTVATILLTLTTEFCKLVKQYNNQCSNALAVTRSIPVTNQLGLSTSDIDLIESGLYGSQGGLTTKQLTAVVNRYNLSSTVALTKDTISVPTYTDDAGCYRVTEKLLAQCKSLLKQLESDGWPTIARIMCADDIDIALKQHRIVSKQLYINSNTLDSLRRVMTLCVILEECTDSLVEGEENAMHAFLAEDLTMSAVNDSETTDVSVSGSELTDLLTKLVSEVVAISKHFASIQVGTELSALPVVNSFLCSTVPTVLNNVAYALREE